MRTYAVGAGKFPAIIGASNTPKVFELSIETKSPFPPYNDYPIVITNNNTYVTIFPYFGAEVLYIR